MNFLIAPLVVSLALGQTAPAAADAPATPSTVPSASEAQSAHPSTPVHARALVPAILGGVTLLGGAAFLIIGEVQMGDAQSLATPEEKEAAESNATSNIVGGVALLSLGALLAGLATVLFLWTPLPATTSVGFSPVNGGGLFSFGMELP